MKEKAIILFLVKFVGLYLLLNTLYGVWVEAYRPAADPLTAIVTHHTAWLVSLFEANISTGSGVDPMHIPIRQNDETVINVFEGCNGLNVMIVFMCFVVAFSSTLKRTALFCLAGFILIYILNLGRVGSLFFVAKYYPDNLYFFHKYAFTGGLYLIVFGMWYLWIQNLRRDVP